MNIEKACSAQARAEMNLCALECASAFLMHNAGAISAQDVHEVMACGVDEEAAMALLMAARMGLDEESSLLHRALVREYLRPSICRLDAAAYRSNPYYSAIRFPQAQAGEWTMTRLSYQPYELFVRDDLLCMEDGREIPQLGYFAERFDYPAVLQGGREWMTITPNEIATMQGAINDAHGHVAVMGLGLGYYAYMVSEKDEVSRVTVIERDADAIALFKKHILPQFPHGDKIRIVRADAFEYAQFSLNRLGAGFVFVDLWHDVSDGAPMYIRMKALERCAPDAVFRYWIEPSIRAFLRNISR